MSDSPITFLEYDDKIRLFNEDAKLLKKIIGIDPSYIRTKDQLKHFVQAYVNTMSNNSDNNLVKTIFLKPYLNV